MARTADERDAELGQLRRSTAVLRAACAETRRESQKLQASLSVEVDESRELRAAVRESVVDRLKTSRPAEIDALAAAAATTRPPARTFEPGPTGPPSRPG
ncbi:MAG: hypothetical protein AB7I59_05580 [Geminicoccaceae bacterium]